jgi:hypothetical protein
MSIPPIPQSLVSKPGFVYLLSMRTRSSGLRSPLTLDGRCNTPLLLWQWSSNSTSFARPTCRSHPAISVAQTMRLFAILNGMILLTRRRKSKSLTPFVTPMQHAALATNKDIGKRMWIRALATLSLTSSVPVDASEGIGVLLRRALTRGWAYTKEREVSSSYAWTEAWISRTRGGLTGAERATGDV